MESTMQVASPSNTQRWASWLLSGLPALFLLADAVGKLVKPAPVIEATVSLGYPESLIQPLGLVLLLGTLVYLFPRTTMLGAIVLTGYLGGAVNTHVRMGAGWFPLLFPVIIGGMLWGGLYLRESRLPVLLPLRKPAPVASRKLQWIGWIMGILPALLLFFSAWMKLSRNPQAVEGFTRYGYPAQAILGIGLLEVLCTVLYLVPATAVLGAVLLTGYMGGAIVTHLRVGEPFLLQVLVGMLLWGGLYLRDERLRALLPWRA